MFVTNKVSGIKDGNKLIKKYGKLLKTRKLSKSRNLKSKKLFKSEKLAKSEKKLLKNRNSSKLDTKKMI